MGDWRDQIATIIAETERNLGARVSPRAAAPARPPAAYYMPAQRTYAASEPTGSSKMPPTGGEAGQHESSYRQHESSYKQNESSFSAPSDYGRLTDQRVMETVK